MASILDYVAAKSSLGGGSTRRARRPDNVQCGDDCAAALAGLTTTASECAENIGAGGTCSSRRVADVIAAFAAEKTGAAFAAEKTGAAFAAEKTGAAFAAEKTGAAFAAEKNGILPKLSTPAAAAVRATAATLGCTSESCVVAHPTLRRFAADRGLGARELEAELESRFKAAGPRDSLALLNNTNLDDTLRRWARVFPEMFPCPFAMMDFDRNGDVFGSADLPAILEGRAEIDMGRSIGKIRRRSTCFACIVNTDTSRGPGKHWVAVFVDCRPPPGEPWTVEYFNSAGNPPPKAMLAWMERTRAQLAEYRAGRPESRNTVSEVVSVPVTDMDHQESQTECGLYALFYIRRRLEKTPYTFFERQRVPDDAMTLFRTHVFRSGK